MRLRLGMLANKNSLIFCLLETGGWMGRGGAKSELSSKPLKMSDFLDILKKKNRSFFEVLKTRVGVVAIFNCLDETKYERFFLQASLNRSISC